MERLKRRWLTPRVEFGYLNCIECKQRMDAPHCPVINHEIVESIKIEEDIKKKSLERAKHEGIDKDERLKDPNDPYYNKIQEFALFKLAYYQCYKCKAPYFGGLKDCLRAQLDAEANQQFKPEDLVCSKCAAVSIGAGIANCAKHGTDYIEFKCKFCCSIAQWFCWGNTHFCEPCHKKQVDGDYVSRKTKAELPKCPGAAGCPLKVKHPDNGEEFALGCALCRNHSENHKDF
jgi:E3 ubiquitin-protein ligase MYCBP2